MENYYDYATGRWVTSFDRYEEVANQPRFRELVDLPEPEHAWALILELLAAVPADLVSHVGSGPLETFINFHAVAFIDRIEAEASGNERLRRAMIEVNLERGTYPEVVEARLLAAFPRFELLDPIPREEW